MGESTPSAVSSTVTEFAMKITAPGRQERWEKLIHARRAPTSITKRRTSAKGRVRLRRGGLHTREVTPAVAG